MPPPQICHEFTRFSARTKGVTVANFYGGIPITQNKELLKKAMPNIVVGTPGRIKQVCGASAKRTRAALPSYSRVWNIPSQTAR